MIFLKDLVKEMKDMCENGINISNIQCRLEALIFDTPAKAFVLCIKRHSGYSSCTKCQTYKIGYVFFKSMRHQEQIMIS